MLFLSQEGLIKCSALWLACSECFVCCSFPFWPKVLRLFKINCMQCLLTVDLFVKIEANVECAASYSALHHLWGASLLNHDLPALLFGSHCIFLGASFFMFHTNCNSFCSLAFLTVFLHFCCPEVTRLCLCFVVWFCLIFRLLKKLAAVVHKQQSLAIPFKCWCSFCKPVSGWFLVARVPLEVVEAVWEAPQLTAALPVEVPLIKPLPSQRVTSLQLHPKVRPFSKTPSRQMTFSSCSLLWWARFDHRHLPVLPAVCRLQMGFSLGVATAVGSVEL